MFKKRYLGLSLVVVIIFMVGKVATNETTTKPLVVAFNKSLYSVSDPNSLWVIVNKARPISPITFIPNNLVTPKVLLRYPGNEDSEVSTLIKSPLENLFSAAKTAKLDLALTSAYRSYDYQTSVYNGFISTLGKTETDKVSARPGYSEHQTGLAVDVEPVSHKCELDACFGTTPEGVWLAANVYKYGFIIRYTSNKTAVTGYSYEPWHIRYVGVLLSNEMHKEGVQTLEEFFNVPGGSNYN